MGKKKGRARGRIALAVAIFVATGAAIAYAIYKYIQSQEQAEYVTDLQTNGPITASEGAYLESLGLVSNLYAGHIIGALASSPVGVSNYAGAELGRNAYRGLLH